MPENCLKDVTISSVSGMRSIRQGFQATWSCNSIQKLPPSARISYLWKESISSRLDNTGMLHHWKRSNSSKDVGTSPVSSTITTLLSYTPRPGEPNLFWTPRFFFTKRQYRIHYPVTSSFVKGGRPNNIKELSNIFNNHPEYATRFLYVEEIVSGGMTQGHYNEILRAEKTRRTSNQIEIKVTGLVHADGNKLVKSLASRFDRLRRENKLFLQFTPNLFTLDDNRQLGTHYLDYDFGPHNVPYETQHNTILAQFWQNFSDDADLRRS